jgi:hypothetical protein
LVSCQKKFYIPVNFPARNKTNIKKASVALY